MRWSWRDIAPRTRWRLPALVPRQKVYIVILRAPDLPDFELPVTTITMRIRNVRASYVRVTVANPFDYTDDILIRMDGRMLIMAGEKTNDGVRHIDELMYANIQNIYLSEGQTNQVLTLTGTRFATYSSPGEHWPEKIISIRKDDAGRYQVRTQMDWFVRPGDMVHTDMGSFESELVSHVVLANNAHTTIEGYDG
jgi:hypothetical protein